MSAPPYASDENRYNSDGMFVKLGSRLGMVILMVSGGWNILFGPWQLLSPRGVYW